MAPIGERRGKIVRYGTMLTLTVLIIYNTYDPTYTPTYASQTVVKVFWMVLVPRTLYLCYA